MRILKSNRFLFLVALWSLSASDHLSARLEQRRGRTDLAS
jgi:hypothetical protein